MADHPCPATGCRERVPKHMLACREHWFSLPLEIRERVLVEYRRGPFSANHLRAVADAYRWLK